MKNYHTHTWRCKHAVGDVADYAKAAVESGITVLGISDHTPLPDNRWIGVRMSMSELDNYCRVIEDEQKINNNLLILKAMECEYVKDFHSFYKEELLDKRKFDYLIVSAHAFYFDGRGVCCWEEEFGGMNSKKSLKAYAEYIADSIDTGLFTFVAHPDMFGAYYLNWDDEAIACSKYIMQAAAQKKIPLEINAYGLRKQEIWTSQGIRHQYPLKRFWELASLYDISVVINSDAHTPEDIAKKTDEAYSIAEEYNLKIADLSYLENNKREIVN